MGIAPVFAAGNSGPRPGTVGAPGAYKEAITIGATDGQIESLDFPVAVRLPFKEKLTSSQMFRLQELTFILQRMVADTKK